jgi:hypothetical protein
MVKTSITTLENRKRFFWDRLKCSALLLHESLICSFSIGRNQGHVCIFFNGKHVPVTNEEVKTLCRQLKTSDVKYEDFVTNIQTNIPNLDHLIELCVSSYIAVMQYEEVCVKDETYIKEPLKKLWEFMLELIYEKPSILTSFDSVVVLDIIRESFSMFISKITPIELTLIQNQTSPRLTKEYLQQHEIQSDTDEKKTIVTEVVTTEESRPITRAMMIKNKPLQVEKEKSIEKPLGKEKPLEPLEKQKEELRTRSKRNPSIRIHL